MRSFTTAILAVIGVLSIQANAQEEENPLYNLFRKKALMQAVDMHYYSPYSGNAFQRTDGALKTVEVADDGTVYGVNSAD